MTGEQLDSGVDSIAMCEDRVDQLTGECRGILVALGLGKVPLEDRAGSALAEFRLEDRRQGKASSGALRPLPIAPAGHAPLPRSGSEAVDDDRHALRLEPEQALDRGRNR